MIESVCKKRLISLEIDRLECIACTDKCEYGEDLIKKFAEYEMEEKKAKYDSPDC